MKIAIGIFLWNEEGSIALTIDSLFAQTIFTKLTGEADCVEVFALANGCTDRSVEFASEAFSRNIANCSSSNIKTSVIELPKGRSPAWNRFVHEFSNIDASYLLCMDADIVINQPNAISSMVDGLERNPKCHLAAALGVKDIETKIRKTIVERLALSFTQLERGARHFFLCGGLYCGRASFLRQIVFPKGFVCGDDGYIARLAITNFYTTDYEFDRILYPEEASFVFEAYSTIPKLFLQHRRRQIGRTILNFIADYVISQQVDKSPNAGLIVRQASDANSDWLLEYSQSRIRAAGFWVIPLRTASYRITQLRRVGFWRRLWKGPVVLLGVAWHVSVIVAANRSLRNGSYLNAWKNNRNTRLKAPQSS